MSAIDLYAHPSSNFADKLKQTAELLEKAAQDYAPLQANGRARIALACSLGAEDMVLAHLIDELQLEVDIFVLETGQLHGETLALLERLKARSRNRVEVLTPVAQAVVQFVARHGSDAMFKSVALRKACCEVRKLEPLARALAGRAAWITGLRREQSGARAQAPLVDTSDPQRVKFNPLSHWSWGDVWHYVSMKKIDTNALHDQFYPSIGCAPCTRAVSVGEDFRAGRWWWESDATKECGLHLRQTPAASARQPVNASQEVTA